MYVQYTSPVGYTILRSGSKILLHRGWDVLFLGVRARGNADEIAPDQEHGLKVCTLAVPPLGWLLRLHYLRFVFWTALKMLAFRPRVVYGSEPFSAMPLWIAKILLRARIIYHEHDPPQVSGAEPASPVVMWLRNAAVRAADLCIVPGEVRAAAFKHQYAQANVRSVWNVVDADEILSRRTARQPNTDLVLWYHGAIVASQLPLALIEALQKVRRARLVFAGPSPVGQVQYLAEFLNAADAGGISDRVRYLGVIPDRNVMLGHMQNADVGLCLFRTPFRAPMVGASQKVFEYLAGGLALLTPSTQEWIDFVKPNNIGLTCDTACFSDLSKTLETILDDLRCLSSMHENAIRLVRNQWNYQLLFQPVVDWMEAPSARH